MFRRALLILSCIAISAQMQTAVAAVPYLVNYSGVLTNSGGAPQVGLFVVTFRVYDVPSGGVAIWTETQNVTSISGGRFTVLLGAVTPISAGEFSGDVRYLGIQISGDAEMSPRTRIASVPYAFRVETVDGAAGGQIGGSLRTGNTNTASGGDNFVGGSNNTASGYAASVTAGIFNNSTSSYTVVAGGSDNRASGAQSFVGAGSSNLASGSSSFVGGGFADSATGSFSVALGGRRNAATGHSSFAGGQTARATHNYSFVWSCDTISASGPTTSTGISTFTVRAPGGATFYSNATQAADDTGVRLLSGSGSWSLISSREAKTDFEPIESDALLENLSRLDIGTWRYKNQDQSIRHIGPVAQEFFAAFGVGEDEKYISAVDADGVALAAIQALCKRNEELESALRDLQSRMDELERRDRDNQE